MSEYEKKKEQLLTEIKDLLLSQYSTEFKKDLNQILFEVKASVNQANIGLSKAIKDNDLGNFKKYVNLGAVLNDDKGEILQRILKNRNIEMLRFSQQHGLDIHQLLQNNENIFLKAVRINYMEGVTYLESQGVEMHLNDEIALNIATKNGQFEIVKFLIEKKFDINMGGGVPLRNACKGKYLDIVKLLVESGAKINNINNLFLIELGKNGSVDVLKYLIEQGLQLNPENEILSLACQYGHFDLVKYLIEDQQFKTYFIHSNSEKSLFRSSIHSGNIELLVYLLKLAPFPQVEVTKSLDLIENDSQFEVLKFLVENGANIEEDTSHVLRYCAQRNATKNTLYLIEKHPNLSSIGDNILKIAAQKQDYELMKNLLDRGYSIPPNQRNNIKGDILEWLNKYAFNVNLNHTLEQKEHVPKAKM